MSEKKYRLTGKCPQCGCSAVSHLTAEEIRAKFKGVDNVELECGECMKKYMENVKEACPEYAKDCKL